MPGNEAKKISVTETLCDCILALSASYQLNISNWLIWQYGLTLKNGEVGFGVFDAVFIVPEMGGHGGEGLCAN